MAQHVESPQRQLDWYWIAWLAVALSVVARLVIAWNLPLGEDEAYYWGWSRHLAFGYIDHPPAVAWLIAAFSWLGREPGVVRLGFILCGVVGALALNDCASRLAGNRVAGVVAALALSLAPFAIGQALPDAPLIAFWAGSLALAVRMIETPTPAGAALLGLPLAGALLSKMLGFALFAGVIAYTLAGGRRAVWSRGFALVPAVALAAYSPFLWWNFQHKWVSFIYAFVTRNGLHHPSFGPAFSVIAGQLATYSPGLWLAAAAAFFAARSALVMWTAAPLAILIAALSIFESVQAHWMLGPYVSLCVGIGLGFVTLRPFARAAWTASAALPAGAMLCLLLVAALIPQAIAATFERVAGTHARDNGPFALFGYRSLARDARRMAAGADAAVMTDEFGLAAAMAYYADLPAVVFGTDVFGRETRGWATLEAHVPRALIVSKAALQASSVFGPRLALACASVRAGPVLRYRFGGAPAGVYYTAWCERPRPNAVRILRWESDNPDARTDQ